MSDGGGREREGGGRCVDAGLAVYHLHVNFCLRERGVCGHYAGTYGGSSHPSGLSTLVLILAVKRETVSTVPIT